MSSPAPASQGVLMPQDPQAASVRPMRLKVLYTFDDQNKTNCLARWHQVLNIRTAHLDENTQIGIIELKTCIQAIVSASPELVAKLGQDYTVYAYDYSEYETPLVGQGMLSWVLASASTTPGAPAHQSRTVVTGRVCKNLLGLFSSGAQETLEVKLRLVPVPTVLQSEYIESMRKYRDLSKIMPEGFDAQAWTNFLQANPGILSVAGQNRSESPLSLNGQKDVGIEHVQRLMNQGYTSQTSGVEPYQQATDGFAISMDEQVFYRGISPAASTQQITASAPPQQNRERTLSRASNRGGQGQKASRRNSIMDAGYASNDDRLEEGPAKKRAKVTKAQWPAKNSFGKQAESLRVAASTAASVRVFQPTAVRPSKNPANSLEEPPRVPTPVPQKSLYSQRPSLAPAKSRLARMSFSMESSDYTSPYDSSEPNRPPESAMTSPEECRTIYTAGDPGSSPPVMPGMIPGRGFTPTPSSPMLPPLPNEAGFMTGTIDELFGDCNDDGELSAIDVELPVTTQYNKQLESRLAEPVMDIVESVETRPALTQQDLSRRQAMNAIASGARALKRTASSGNTQQSLIPASDPVRPTSRNLQRSNTWSGKETMSDGPTGSDTGDAPPKRKYRRGWNHAKRKNAIKSKLETSVAAGEIPPFCDNCGDIETPTWRKAYYKVHCGGMELVSLSDDEGGIIACVEMETNEDGSTKLFKIIKKSLLKTDKGFTEFLMCNPCGLWLASHKALRPKNLWGQRKEDKPNKGGSRKKSESTEPKNGNGREDSANPPSDASSPTVSPLPDPPSAPKEDDALELPPMNRHRALSAQTSFTSIVKSDGPVPPSAIAALQRAIASSPGRFLGTKHIPIEIEDLTPKPTRRVLFPSPKSVQNKAGGLSLAECSDIPSARQTPTKPFVQVSTPSPTTALAIANADKENQAPLDPFRDLFDEGVPRLSSCPSSPTSTRKLPSNPFKTPTKSSAKRMMTTGDFFATAAKDFLHPKTPSRTPSQARTPLSDRYANMTPFTRHLNESLDSDLNLTPSRFTPSKLLLDFPLPGALNGNVSGFGSVRCTPSRDFRPEDFDFGDLEFGGGMPSSPPPASAWFGVYEDPNEVTKGWGDLGLGSSPFKEKGGEKNHKEGEKDVLVKAEADDEG